MKSTALTPKTFKNCMLSESKARPQRSNMMAKLLQTTSIVVLGCLVGARADGAVVIYSETFDAATVPTNWAAQNGTAGTATLGIVDDSGGIDSGNALSIVSATRQGVIGTIDEVSFASVGDRIQLSFDARLLSYPNNSGGFRFGLYHDNDGLELSSGYRIFVGTGTNAPRTDVAADGGDPDIMFGVNRENPPGFLNTINGINSNEPHHFELNLTRTVDGVLIDVFQNGVASFAAPVLHIPGTGAGVATPLQTRFNQIAFTTNGGISAIIDNVQVTYIPEPSSLLLMGIAIIAIRGRQWRGERE